MAKLVAITKIIKRYKIYWPALVLILLILCGVLFYLLNLDQYLTLEYLKIQKNNLKSNYYSHPLLVMLIYVVGYIFLALALFPAPNMLNVLGGAVFGLWPGIPLASLANTTGAIGTFYLSRYLLRGFVQKKFHDKLKRLNASIKKEGSFYLLSVRLVPVFPYVIVNLLTGVTPIQTSSFIWASFVGMLPATIAYVNAGTQLAQIKELSDVASANLLISLAILGLLPLLSKWILQLVRKKKS